MKLQYKDVVFDSFSFSDDDCKEYIDESNANSLQGFEGGGWGYICPHCIKTYELYNETDLSENEVDEIIDEESHGVADDLICCVDDCYNKNAYDINFETSKCKLIKS